MRNTVLTQRGDGPDATLRLVMRLKKRILAGGESKRRDEVERPRSVNGKLIRGSWCKSCKWEEGGDDGDDEAKSGTSEGTYQTV